MSNLVSSSEFITKHRTSSKHFTRKRTLTFPRLLLFMMNMINSSIQIELSRFFQTLSDGPVAELDATTAAFCKARKKVSHTAFQELNDFAVRSFYESNEVRRWKGFRLMAIDGSVAKLPISDELFDYYGKAREHSRYPAVRLSQLYDVQNKISLDVQVDTHKTGERDMAIRHFKWFKENDLVIMDRGYPGVWFFKKIREKNAHYCVRTKNEESNITKAFLESDQRDLIVKLPCVEKSLRRCKKESLDTKPLTVRLVKVILPTGEIEILITSLLDPKKYPRSLFKKLYHKRWGVEEDYKVMKSRTNIENFSGKSVLAILQDIHAKALAKNITAIAMSNADKIKKDKDKKRKLEHTINFTQALGLIKNNIIRMFLGNNLGELCRMLTNKMAKMLTAIRPGRWFKRPEDKRTRVNKYPMAYKRTC